MESSAQPEPKSARRAYKGSCHCGFIKYVVYIPLPPTALEGTTPEEQRERGSVRIYKCNCTTCQKLGLFHLRPPAPTEDFALLSPLDPFTELGDYLVFDKLIHWFFCKTCGGRCFSLYGEGEVVTKEIEGETRQVWIPKPIEQGAARRLYLSVNAHSLDEGQEGLDLREWHEKGWIQYLDVLDMKEEPRFGKPYRGGIY